VINKTRKIKVPLVEVMSEPEFSISKLALTIDCPNDEQRAVRKSLNQLRKSDRYDVRPIESKACTYRRAYLVDFDGGSCLNIFLDPISDSQRYLKLAWEPSYVEPDEITDFLNVLFGNGLSSILMSGNVSQFKLAIIADDIKAGLFAHKANVRVSNIRWDKNHNYVIHQSIGSPNSDCQTIISARLYKGEDANKSLRTAKYEIIHSFKNLNCTLGSVWDLLKSEMKKLALFNSNLLVDDNIPKRLIKKIAENGIPYALSEQDKTARQEVLNLLNSRYAVDPISITKKQYMAEFNRCFGFFRNLPK
jgi:hypothetical protein